MKKPNFESYAVGMRPLSKAEGGGWLITWPDLPGCMSDGETPEEAITNGREAFAAWMDAHKKTPKQAAPKPSIRTQKPARFVLRTPKSMHAKLVAQAENEGVSLNTLITAIIAENIGHHRGV